jgi:DNA ligase-1
MLEQLYTQLKNTPSTNSKIEILKSVSDTRIKILLALCHDPMKQFFINKFSPDTHIMANSTFESSADAFIQLLTDLNKRIYTGNAAKFKVESFLSGCLPETQHVYSLILKKDLKVGIGVKLLNSAFGEDFINEFTVQLSNKYLTTKKYKDVEFWYSSPKLDGLRSYGSYDKMLSRSGHDQFGFEKIQNEINILLDMGFTFTDGELFSDEVDFEDIQGIVTTRKNIDPIKKESVYYNVFYIGRNDYKDTSDMVDAMNSIDWTQFKYLRQVKYEVIKNDPILITKKCRRLTNDGFEGIMLRHPKIQYEWKRSNALLKYKLFKEDDFKCIGFNPGEIGTKYEHTLGTILVEGVDIIIDEEGIEIGRKPVCSEVSGFKDPMRHEIWNNQDFYMNKIVEVKYQNSTARIDKTTGKYSLRFASFLKWKLDR